MKCKRCNGTGFLNLNQIEDQSVIDAGVDSILEWIERQEPYEYTVCVCDYCGNGFEWYKTPGEIDELEPVTSDTLRCSFQREWIAFQQLLPLLLKTHLGKYVAFAEGNLVDEDKDEIKLAKRIEQRYRDRFVLIRQVCQEDTEDQLPSPEADILPRMNSWGSS